MFSAKWEQLYNRESTITCRNKVAVVAAVVAGLPLPLAVVVAGLLFVVAVVAAVPVVGVADLLFVVAVVAAVPVGPVGFPHVRSHLPR